MPKINSASRRFVDPKKRTIKIFEEEERAPASYWSNRSNIILSWLIPFIGHIGICREDGVILDFAGPNFVCVDNFTFGSVARYIQISKKQCSHLLQDVASRSVDEHQQNERNVVTWDDAIRKSTQEYQHHAYNLLSCNCHSFVANNLNRLGFNNNRWNMVNLATLIFLTGRWVDKTAMTLFMHNIGRDKL
ncbi:hypothetical protein QQ045_016024 [Rhodiola kirilowii]